MSRKNLSAAVMRPKRTLAGIAKAYLEVRKNSRVSVIDLISVTCVIGVAACSFMFMLTM